MTIKQVLIIALTISILTSCRRGYKVEADKVYYYTWNEGSGQNKRLVEQADARTFKKLTFDCDYEIDFAMDKDHLFFDGELINNIDPSTFKFIGNYIFRDKDSAYFFGSYNNIQECAIRGVNPDKIKIVEYPWAKADNLLIHGRDTVTIYDINNFFPIDENWGRTNKQIINENQIIYGADVASFKPISSFEGKDKNFNYEFGIIKEDDFDKVNYKTFNFNNKDFCSIKPIVFVDIYDSLVSYSEEKNRFVILEKLKEKGFNVVNTNYFNWRGESKIIRTTLSNKKCNCIIEKIYSIDYSKPSETKNIFKVTERIYHL